MIPACSHWSLTMYSTVCFALIMDLVVLFLSHETLGLLNILTDLIPSVRNVVSCHINPSVLCILTAREGENPVPVKVPDTHRCRFLLCNAVRLMKRSQTRKERFCQPLSLLYWNSGKIARKIFGQFKNFLFPKDILKEKFCASLLPCKIRLSMIK